MPSVIDSYLDTDQPTYYGGVNDPPPVQVGLNSDDPDDELEGQPPSEIQEDQINQRMLAGENPDADPGGDFGQGPVDAGAYVGGDSSGPDISYISGIGLVPANMSVGQGDALPPSTSRSIPVPAVSAPDNWLSRIGQKLGLAQNGGSTGPATVGGPQPTLVDRYKALEKAYEQMPVRGTPNWLERIAAGALGGAAGYSNAARRAAPIDIGKATQGILYPGYDSKLAAWQSRIASLEHAAELSAQQTAAGWKGQQIQSEAQLHQAQAQMALDRANYYRNLASQNRVAPVPVTPELEEMSGGAFKVGQTIPAADAMKIALGAAAKYEKMLKVTTPEMAKATGQPINSMVPASTYNAGITANTREDTTRRPIDKTKLELRSAGAVTGDPEIDKYTPQQARRSIENGKVFAPRDPTLSAIAEDRLSEQQQQHIDALRTKKQVDDERAWSNYRLANENAAKASNEAERKRLQELATHQLRAQLQSSQDTFTEQLRGRRIPAQDYDVSIGPDGMPQTTPRPQRAAAPGAFGGPPTPPAPPQHSGNGNPY